MKRIVSHCSPAVMAPVLLAPWPVTAAQAGQPDNPGLASFLPVIVVGIVLVLLVARQLFMRSGSAAPTYEPGRPRNYGIAGAAVCRNCGRPFPRSPLDPNMLVGKLVRCPYCRKWAVLPAASPAELAAAEERERQMHDPKSTEGGAHPQLSEEERLRRRIENSKYE